MTNEERVEERLLHAYERGYYHKVLPKIKEMQMIYPKRDKYEIYDIVCDELKAEWLKEKNDGIIEHTPN